MSSTIHLTTKEDRRTWQALTRCAPTVDDDPELAFVCLDGERAYATDTYLVGCLDADNGRYPPASKLADYVDGDPLAIFTEGADGTVSKAGEVVTRIGLDADRLARLSSLEYRLADQVTGYVTVRPRPATTILEIRSVATVAKLGVLTQIRSDEADTRRGSTASRGRTDEITITEKTAQALADADERLEADERKARDDA